MNLGPAPLPAPPSQLVVRVLIRLRRWLLRIADLLLPSDVVVFDRCAGMADTLLMREAARLKIPDLLDGGPQDAVTLASTLGVDADVLHRILRALVARGIFSLDGKGRFTNNHVSRGMRSGVGTSRNFVAYLGDTHNVLAWDRVGETLRDGRCGFARAYDGAGLWEWYEANPDQHEQFAAMMADATVGDASSVATAYPWKDVASICDVGGGIGVQLSEILVRTPGIRGTLFDSPRTVERSKDMLRARGIADRVEHASGSFFDAVPAGADAYLLKNILHDWGDEPSLRILEVVRKAMKPGAKVVVAEWMFPRNGVDHPAALSDVHMMMLCEGGRERSEDEMKKLLARAGLRTTRVFSTPVFLSLLEAVAD